MSLLENLKDVITELRNGRVIIYPTESVFGLGCDPDNVQAVYNLLMIKNRSWKKGLILVAANYMQLLKYINHAWLGSVQLSRVFSTWPGPVTWLFPIYPDSYKWLTGQHSSLAVRVSNYEPIKRLCLAFGKPIVSTSANLSGYPPAKTISEVYNQLGYNFPIMCGSVLGRLRPSIIKDAITGKLIRE